MFGILGNMFDSDEEGGIEMPTFEETKKALVKSIKEEATACGDTGELVEHYNSLVNLLAKIDGLKDGDITGLYEIIESVPALPDNKDIKRSDDFDTLIKGNPIKTGR